MAAKFRVLIVGCGAVTERYHLPALAEVDEVQVAAVADADLARAQELAERFGVPAAVQGFEDTLGDSDCVLVATPHGTHAEIVTACLRAGKHVLCEKPLATTVAECDLLIEEAGRSAGCLHVGLMRRMYPGCRWLKGALEAGVLGRVKGFLFEEGGPYSWPTSSGFFWNRAAAGGGVLADTGAHTLDLLTWWLGEWESVEYQDDNLGNMEAHCRLDLTLREGVRGRVELSRLHALPNRFRIECEQGWFEAGARPPSRVVMYDARIGHSVCCDAMQGEVPLPWAGQPARGGLEAFVLEWREVARSMRGERTCLATAADARKVARLIAACYARRRPLPQPWLGPQFEGAGA